MRILLLGAAGLLGRALEEELSASHELIPRTRKDYDLRDQQAFIHDLESSAPHAVINAAAYTAVDRAEEEEELARQVNGLAVGNLARACRERQVRFIHFSTDYVFNGQKKEPYREEDPPSPLNAYGRSKLLGERKVWEEYPEASLVLRTSWLFGPGGTNFVKTMLDHYDRGRREFKVVADQRGRPTYSRHLARITARCLEAGLSGLYHAADQGAVSWFEFAEEIFKEAGLADQVSLVPAASEEVPRPAARPRNSVLSTEKLEAALGEPMPLHLEGLRRYLKEEGRL